MKNIFLLLSFLALSACAGTSATKSATEVVRGQITNVAESVERLQNSLPENCRTAAIESQFENLQSQIDNLYVSLDSIWDTHTSEIKTLESDYNQRGMIILVLVIIVCVLIYGSRR